jgi:integrase
MAAIRERGGKFHAQVRMAGYPARTQSFPTRRLAERWAKTVEAEMIEGRAFRNVEARRRTLGEAIDRYILEELPKKRDGSTHRTCLPWWKQRLGHLRLADVTPALLVEHRGKLSRETFARSKGAKPRQYPRSAATVNRYLSALSHVFTVARREWHWVGHNPFEGVGKLSEGRGRVRFLSEDERAALLAETAKDSQLHLLVVIALSTAARAGELLNLRWRDVDLAGGRVLLRHTKNAHPRTAWLHGEALRLLTAHGRVRRLADDRVFLSQTGRRYRYDGAFAAACAAAKVIDFRFHDLRHSAATYLARAGASEQQLRAIGGWRSGIVSRYVHIGSEDARAVVALMNKEILGK